MRACDFAESIRIITVESIYKFKEEGGRGVKKMRKISLAVGCFLFAACLWNSQSLTSHAEEIAVPGYHVYTVTEDESIDTWYGIARGTYLQGGISGLKRAGTGKVNVSGTTNAHSVCDKVKVAVYLDESVNGKTGFGTIGSYYFSKENTASCHGSKADISVTSGWWYLVRGVHSVTEGSVTETTETQTTALEAY